MKGVVNPQATPTSKKPTIQRQMGGSDVDWTSIAFNAKRRQINHSCVLYTCEVGMGCGLRLAFKPQAESISKFGWIDIGPSAPFRALHLASQAVVCLE